MVPLDLFVQAGMIPLHQLPNHGFNLAQIIAQPARSFGGRICAAWRNGVSKVTGHTGR